MIYRVASRVAERLTIESYEIRKNQENVKIPQNDSLVVSLPRKSFANTSKKLLKIEIKLFP